MTRPAPRYNGQIRSGFASLIYMDEDEITGRLTKISQLMDQLIFVFMQMGMSYRQAEDELFRRLKRKGWLLPTRRRSALALEPPAGLSDCVHVDVCDALSEYFEVAFLRSE